MTTILFWGNATQHILHNETELAAWGRKTSQGVRIQKSPLGGELGQGGLTTVPSSKQGSVWAHVEGTAPERELEKAALSFQFSRRIPHRDSEGAPCERPPPGSRRQTFISRLEASHNLLTGFLTSLSTRGQKRSLLKGCYTLPSIRGPHLPSEALPL